MRFYIINQAISFLLVPTVFASQNGILNHGNSDIELIAPRNNHNWDESEFDLDNGTLSTNFDNDIESVPNNDLGTSAYKAPKGKKVMNAVSQTEEETGVYCYYSNDGLHCYFTDDDVLPAPLLSADYDHSFFADTSKDLTTNKNTKYFLRGKGAAIH